MGSGFAVFMRMRLKCGEKTVVYNIGKAGPLIGAER